MKHLEIHPGERPPTRDFPAEKGFSNANLQPAEVKLHPSGPGDENASIFFVGTATTILSAILTGLSVWKVADYDGLPENGKAFAS